MNERRIINMHQHLCDRTEQMQDMKIYKLQHNNLKNQERSLWLVPYIQTMAPHTANQLQLLFLAPRLGNSTRPKTHDKWISNLYSLQNDRSFIGKTLQRHRQEGGTFPVTFLFTSLCINTLSSLHRKLCNLKRETNQYRNNK